MKRILVTGASGLLGLNFCHFCCRRYEVIGISNRTHLVGLPFRMISRDLLNESTAELLDTYQPDVILHCAAMANLDRCEKFPEQAAEINSRYPGQLAAESGKRGIKFVHISTNAVFDGEDCGDSGYRETDRTNPVSCYGRTKLDGEHHVLDSNPEALVARVNFYGWSVSGKHSLVEFFYDNLKAGNRINGFSDVFFNVFYVHTLSDILADMIDLDAKGLYHVFSPDHQSKYDFGVSIAEKFGFDPQLISPVSWKSAGLNAKRSPNLIMNTDKLKALLHYDLPTQPETLDDFYRDTCDGLRQQIRNSVDPKNTEA